ncbi:MAG: ring-cleaving dioxygenase [Solirubrobacterales bacterium]|jgi:glyoxalase family protein|nr:ring-cleaving dioxygenase [Solirubrobacterales bacterium]
MDLDGIHHISAITGDARRNVDFYTRVLGLRLTAKTVNQDDPSVYHLFYGDEHARPGADLTFFEYPRAIPGRPGAGMVHTIVSRVGSDAALDFWAARLAAEGVPAERTERSLRFADPEGLQHELVVPTSSDPPLTAVHPEIPAEHALQGFEGVRAYSAHPEGSGVVLERLMGATPVGPKDAWVGGEQAWELRGDRRGGWIAFDPAPAEPGRQSAGTVHHIAWGTYDEDLPSWIEEVTSVGIPNSGYVDRHYFHSLYFREPGGVLYELATEEPGFLVDGLDVGELGTKIILPPFLEDQRAAAEAKLTPLPDPRADWPASFV